MKGFSGQNLWRMKQLYETYKGNKKLSPLVRELSWSQGFLKVILTGTFKRPVRDKDMFLFFNLMPAYRRQASLVQSLLINKHREKHRFRVLGNPIMDA